MENIQKYAFATGKSTALKYTAQGHNIVTEKKFQHNLVKQELNVFPIKACFCSVFQVLHSRMCLHIRKLQK